MSSQAFLQENAVEYWTGQPGTGTSGDITPSTIKWGNKRSVALPSGFDTIDPRSVVICVYPTGAPQYLGQATVAVTVVDTFEQSRFATVVTERVPRKRANFKFPTEIHFSYVIGKYIYARKFCFCCIKK